MSAPRLTRDDLELIRKRADSARGGMARARFRSAGDVPRLLAELEALTAERDALRPRPTAVHAPSRLCGASWNVNDPPCSLPRGHEGEHWNGGYSWER